jgi:hypothetical protein
MTLPVRSAADAEPSRRDADTYGWDTAFAINFTHANRAIAAGWASVSDKAKNLRQIATDDDSYHIEATLGPWQLTMGGDGKNIRMACPVVSGTYTAGKHVYQLTGIKMQIVIEVGMEWVPNPDQFAFVIGGNTEVDAIKAGLDKNAIPGDLAAEFKKRQKPLSPAAAALVQIQGKEWLITDGKTYYYLFAQQDKEKNEFLNVYQFQDSWAQNLQVLKNAVSDEQPAVAIITIPNNPTSGGVPGAVLAELLSVWFNINIGEFNHVFASLDLSPQISQSDRYAWMKPTATTYAVTDQGTLESSVFGVLTMAQHNPASANHQVSPFAIPSGADAGGANAGFLIGGTNFVRYMMLPAAQVVFNDAPVSAFEIVNDGLTIQNVKDMVWGKFMMDDKKKGSVAASFAGELDAGTISANLRTALKHIHVTAPSSYSAKVTTKGSQWLLTDGRTDDNEFILTKNGNNIDVYLATAIRIAKGRFKLTLIHGSVQIEFIDLNYSYSADFDVHVNYSEQVKLTLQNKDGKQIFWYDQVQKNMVVSVTKTQSAITRQIVEGAVTAALALIAVAGPIIEGLSAGAEIGEVTEEGGEAIIDAETFEEIAEQNPEAELENELNSAENAAAQSGGKLTAIKNAFNTPKWKFAASISALAGAVVGIDTTIAAIIEAAANKKWNEVPGFDKFANELIAPYTFPDVESFSLASAWLAGSLQVGLKVKSASA